MPGLIDRIANQSRPPVWLDDVAYVERLLGGGRTPWLESAAFVAFRRKAAGLLKSELTVVPLARMTEAWLGTHAPLKDAMAAKKRAVAPLRSLLAAEDLRANLVDTVRALRSAISGLPLVLSLPSPRLWVAQAYRAALGSETEVGADEADAGAVYVAEFLRSFGEAGVDALLLEEAAGAEPSDASEIDWYQPVLNLAAHYRWDVGLRLPDAGGFKGEVRGLGFTIAPTLLSGALNGIALPAAFWNGAEAPSAPAGGFRFAEIPADAVPEKVLERLAVLRGE